VNVGNTIFVGADGRVRSGWRFVLALVAIIVATLIASAFAAAISRNFVASIAISRPLSALLMFLSFWVLARALDRVKEPSRHLGLSLRTTWIRDLAAGAFCGGLMVSACIGIVGLLGSYHVSPSPPLQVSKFAAGLLVAWTLVGGAIAEEMMFRSYGFFRLSESLSNLFRALPVGVFKDRSLEAGTWAAILVLSALFGAGHLKNPNVTFWGFADTVLIGIFFGVVMVRTGSLWLLWGIHFGWNFTLGVLFGLPVSGINQFSVLTTGFVRGPSWLTGGNYGIEASATAAFVVSIALIAVLRYRKPSTADMVTGIQAE
jgi:hypothetical protein